VQAILRKRLHIALRVETRIAAKIGEYHRGLPAIPHLKSDAAKGLIF
jgi:hypothetical protein